MKSWFFWTASVALSTLTLWGLHALHQQRPTEVLVLQDAAFMGISETSSSALPRQTEPHSVRLPHDWRDEENPLDRGVYQFSVDFDVAPNRLWGLYIPSLEMTPVVRINNTSISGEQRFADPLPRYWNRPVYYSVPSGLMRPGMNTIEVELAANGQWGRLSEIYLGAHTDLYAEFRDRSMLRVGVGQITTFVCFAFAFFTLCLFLVRREKQFAYFSLFVLSWGLTSYVMLEVHPWLPNVYWDLLVYASLGFLLGSASVFASEFTGSGTPRGNRAVLATAAIGPLVLLAMTPFDIVMFNMVGSALWVGALVVLGLRPMSMLGLKMHRNPNIEYAAMATACLMAVPLAAKDWLVTAGVGYRHDGFMMQFAAAPIVLAFGVVLLRRFVGALRESEELNAHLTERVEQKVAEAEAANQRTRALEAERLINSERERIMRDMHDGIGGHLVGSIAQLDPHEVKEAQLRSDLELALTDLRLMMDSMDHSMTELTEILAVFRHRVDHRFTSAGVTSHWSLEPCAPCSLDAERKLHLLRILQEAVTNILRHAQASQVIIAVQQKAGRIQISIQDDGKGLNQQELPGRGITNMRYRAEQAHFGFALQTCEWGIEVTVTIPLESDLASG